MNVNRVGNQINFNGNFYAKPVIIKVIRNNKPTKIITGEAKVFHTEKKLLKSNIFTKLNNWWIKGKYGIVEKFDEAKNSFLEIPEPFHHRLFTDAKKIKISNYIRSLNAPNATVEVKKGVETKNIFAKEIVVF